MTDAEQLATALTSCRLEAGGPSFEKIARGLIPIMGEDAPTAETIRTYHNVGGLKRTVDLEIATALATYYDTTLADLSPDLADKARRKVLMLVGGGAAGRLMPGGDAGPGEAEEQFKKPGSSTRSNRTGPGRKTRRGRTPGHIGSPVCEPAAA